MYLYIQSKTKANTMDHNKQNSKQMKIKIINSYKMNEMCMNKIKNKKEFFCSFVNVEIKMKKLKIMNYNNI